MSQGKDGKQMTGGDIRESMKMAGGSMGEVQDEVKRLAAESRPQVLTGDERRQFFEGMTQHEFEVMHSMAVAMGPRGVNALERLMREAEQMKKDQG